MDGKSLRDKLFPKSRGAPQHKHPTTPNEHQHKPPTTPSEHQYTPTMAPSEHQYTPPMAPSEHEQHLKKLLYAVNNAATVLLTLKKEDGFEPSLLNSMELIGRCVEVDRVQIWQNEMIDGSLHFVMKYKWISEAGKKKKSVPVGLTYPYSFKPEWESKFLRGEIINSPLSKLTYDDQEFLETYEIKSIAIIPLFIKDSFWGFFSLSDCYRERTFTDNEISVLRSAGLMMISAVNRNKQAAEIYLAHERARLLLEQMPLTCHLWDIDFNIFEYNDANNKLFDASDMEDFSARFFDFSPKYQPDGMLSTEKVTQCIGKAFKEGAYVVEWMHQLLDGTPIPCEITLKRINFGERKLVAAYVRDLREHKRMLMEIEHRDRLLDTANKVAAILLSSDADKFEDDLHLCMGMMAAAVDVDKMRIIKIDDAYNSQIYMWPTNAASESLPAAMHGSADGEGVPVAQVSFDGEGVPAIYGSASHDKHIYEKVPIWEEALRSGSVVTGLVREMPPEARAHIANEGILSIFVAPVFLRGKLWGCIGYDDCHGERQFTENEQSIMRSGGLMIVNALLRHEMTQSINAASVKLEAALDEARNANSAKSNFLANMSHEMRTPMNAVIGFSELMLSENVIGRACRIECVESIRRIHSAGMTLLNIINDILDISKIEAGRFEITPEEYDLPSFINDTVTLNISRVADKPIRFELDIDASLPCRLLGDDLRIKQICNNLLSNAFKYTKEGTVTWRIRCGRGHGDGGDDNEAWLTFCVQDTGIGISDNDLAKLFTDYSQVDTKSNRRIEGTGLGLALTKKMVEMMGGDIFVESEYGKGSKFTVRIPQKFVNDRPIGAAVVENLKNQNYADEKRENVTKLARLNLPYANILLVDDLRVNLEVAKGLMKPYGMRIDCAMSGADAIEMVRQEKVKYSAIFMDHMMPGMDGVEATRIIREEIGTEYARKVPIIVLTANAIAGNEEMFLSNGFQDFLSKPIDIMRMDSVIRHWVRDKNMEAAQAADAAKFAKAADATKFAQAADTAKFAQAADTTKFAQTADAAKFAQTADATKFAQTADAAKFTHAANSTQAGGGTPNGGAGIIGLDYDEAMVAFGDKEIFTDILKVFADDTPLYLNEMRHVARNRLKDYAIVAHGLKGSCRGVFATAMGEQAERLEKAALADQFDYVMERNGPFIESMETMLSSLNRYLGNSKEPVQ